MTSEVFDRVLSEVAQHVPPIRVAVLYHGGEPFLNKQFLSMVSSVKALGIPLVKTVTNGMSIRRELCDAIATSGLDEIEFSLDGEDAKENDAVRQRCDFKYVVDVVRALAAANARHGLRMKIAIATVQFRRAIDTDFEREPEVPAFLREAFSDLGPAIHFKPTWAIVWPSGQPASGYDVLHDNRPRSPAVRCRLLEDTITIRADGTVVACCYDLLTQSSLGNIVRESLDEIWNGGQYRRFREGFSTGDYPSLCRNCAVVTGNRYLVKRGKPAPQTVHESRLAGLTVQ
jgi:radical SAM protein with 4Fe4S-binding SPASM domain